MTRVLRIAGIALSIAGIAAVSFLIGHFAFSGGESQTILPPADAPPLQYVDLNPQQVATYVSQLEDGLATTQQRTEQLTSSVNASIAAGSAAQVGAAQERKIGTQATVTQGAADLFYAFMRLLRAGGEANCRPTGDDGHCDPAGCNGQSRTRWLGEVDETPPTYDAKQKIQKEIQKKIQNQVSCIGVGNFIRIAHAQLFLPPFAQALPRAQNAQAFYGGLPAPRTAFTSPSQLPQVQASLASYTKRVGHDPRLPFVAAPYGSGDRVGEGITFVVPVHYRGLTSEPALLSGSVTIVGKIIYYAPGGQSYIDYPTIDQFGKPLLEQGRDFRDAIGICSSVPPVGTRGQASGPKPTNSSCVSAQGTLNAVKRSVTYSPPVVVVLPVAVYQ